MVFNTLISELTVILLSLILHQITQLEAYLWSLSSNQSDKPTHMIMKKRISSKQQKYFGCKSNFSFQLHTHTRRGREREREKELINGKLWRYSAILLSTAQKKCSTFSTFTLHVCVCTCTGAWQREGEDLQRAQVE